MGFDAAGGDGDVTFRGRGLARRADGRLVLLVCPVCSQRNARRLAERGVCAWCAYEPSVADAEPVAPARSPRAA